MKIIKGVHRHGSETFLLYLKDSKNNKLESIIKRSTSKKGIKSIVSEYEGVRWYNKRNKNKIICELQKITDRYVEIKIVSNKKFFNIKSNNIYTSKIKYIDLTIRHYINVWCDYVGQTYAPFHGDLSLVGNVMFNDNDEVLFVDWEQFESNINVPTGLDLIMMLLENIWYDLKKSKKIRFDVLKHFENSIYFLNKTGLLSPLLLNNPAANALKFINSNTDIWNGQHFKLPVLRLSEKNILEIDSVIT